MALTMHALTPAAQFSTFLGRPLETRNLRVSQLRRFSVSTSSSPHLININARGGRHITPQPPPPAPGAAFQAVADTSQVARKDFPSDFMFGAGSSAFQIEGAPTAGGRGLTIWDSFIQTPGTVVDGSVNHPGCDFYHLYEDDIQRAKDMGLTAFRLSISWTRIYPNGSEQESAEGIQFYNNVINAVVRAGLTPFVTIFHWETPQYLENDPEVLGFRTKNIVPYLVKLADTCFRHFGDRVKIWATANEMWTFCVNGYGRGSMAPGRCSSVSGNECKAGDSATEPYLAGHHLLLAHAKVYQLYNTKYKPHQLGVCGFNPCHFGVAPYSDSQEDRLAVERYLEFFSGWQLDPVVFGDYPKSMRDALGERLPKFTKEESEELKNSCDFLGHNIYSAYFIQNAEVPKDPSKRWWWNDGGNTTSLINKNGDSIGVQTGPANSWVHNCAPHVPPLLEWLQNRYGRIPCYITENGSMDPSPENSIESVNDQERITYIRDHLFYLSKAINDMGINLKGYFYWSFLDVFEWDGGLVSRFGLFRVDFEDGKEPTRTPKASAKWLKAFLAGKVE